MQTHRIHTVTDPAFAALVKIYCDAIPQSERKSIQQLSSMIERPQYLFLAASRENVVVGFSITLCFTGCNACLLEYMAVAASFRAQGIGRYLFTELLKRKEVAGHFLLAEVDSDETDTRRQTDAAKRKAFYRNLGCREIEGLRYIMPPVASIPPPDMNLFACKHGLPRSIERTHLRKWLQCIYTEVYAQPANDHRLEQMLTSLPHNITLT